MQFQLLQRDEAVNQTIAKTKHQDGGPYKGRLFLPSGEKKEKHKK